MSHQPTWLSIAICAVFLGCSENSKPQAQPKPIYPSQAELTSLIQSTKDSVLSAYNVPGFIFRYGIGARNVFNTFAGTYTLLADTGAAISVPLVLPKREIDSVFGMMHTIGFFEFPDTFAYLYINRVSQTAGSGSSIYFGVRFTESGVLRQKELWWIDYGYTESTRIDERAANLRRLILKLRMLVEDKPAVQKMSRPLGFQGID
jgi:hypothetical protein